MDTVEATSGLGEFETLALTPHGSYDSERDSQAGEKQFEK